MSVSGTARGPKRDWHGAHHAWSYRPQAFRWIGEELAGINILPLATELRSWLMRRGQLSIISSTNDAESGGYSNPYALSGSTLSMLMSRVVNASHDYATTTTPTDDQIGTELERLRLYNEVLLYSARFCEAAVKQLLYCTQIPESRYARMGLGALLESPCPSCKKTSGKKPHLVSLVGTLAHPFGLCIEFEQCAMDHMELVNKLRNSEAAHSGSQQLHVRTVEESKTQLQMDSSEVLTGFLHMLSHLSELEESMLDDLASKGNSITLLKRGGLPAQDCNFNLIPGEPFTFNMNAPSQ